MASHHLLEGLNVLVVEDEPILAFELIEDLQTAGAIPVGPSASVSDALKWIFTAERIDAALLNLRLRGEQSFPVAEELQVRGIPFVFVTGNDETVKAHFPNVPVHPKPADMTKIVKTLAALVAERAQAK